MLTEIVLTSLKVHSDVWDNRQKTSEFIIASIQVYFTWWWGWSVSFSKFSDVHINWMQAGIIKITTA